MLQLRSCIRYVSAFKTSELQQVKLTQAYDDGTKRQRECPIFTGHEGVEGLLYVKERFDKLCRYLTYTEGEELFNNFDACLSDNAQEQWENITSELVDRSVDSFNNAFQRFLRQYCDSRARDDMFDYLTRSDEIQKKHNADCRTHGERIRTLVRRCNALPGTINLIDPNQEKKILFQSYPEDWQMSFERSGRDYATATLTDIMSFMVVEKVHADARMTKRRNAAPHQHNPRDPKRGRTSNYQHGQRTQGRFGQYQYQQQFPVNNYGNNHFQRGGRGNYRGGRVNYPNNRAQSGRHFNRGGYTPYQAGRFMGRGPPARGHFPTPPPQQQYHFHSQRSPGRSGQYQGARTAQPPTVQSHHLDMVNYESMNYYPEWAATESGSIEYASEENNEYHTNTNHEDVMYYPNW